ncbi:MAG TPA: LytTR family DNA-binding domain-containing protein [Chitinophagales bacterium]|nr:LytTR family DNA-binding domain-containing protein [Chitinophagales bacterium]
MNIVIIEDDPIAKDILVEILASIKKELKIDACCSTLCAGKSAIRKHQPTILFLDIELPDGKGIDMLDEIDKRYKFETIFTTSHDSYAIEAFRKNAVDYILKPVTKKLVHDAILKVEKRITHYKELEEAAVLKEKMKVLNEKTDAKFLLSTKDGMQIVLAKDIIRVESEKNYSCFHLNNNKKIISSKTLTSFEDKLQENHFYRIHRSVMINLNYIQNIKHDKQKGYVVVMNDNTELEIARRKRKEFLQLFS